MSRRRLSAATRVSRRASSAIRHRAARKPMTVERFTSDVLSAIPHMPQDGFFGDRNDSWSKVFIAFAWAWMRSNWRKTGKVYGDMTLVEFKRWLLAAHRARLLTLSRADLVEAMDPHMVAKSEIAHGNATFHFINQ